MGVEILNGCSKHWLTVCGILDPTGSQDVHLVRRQADVMIIHTFEDGPASIETAGIPDLNAVRRRSRSSLYLSEVITL